MDPTLYQSNFPRCKPWNHFQPWKLGGMNSTCNSGRNLRLNLRFLSQWPVWLKTLAEGFWEILSVLWWKTCPVKNDPWHSKGHFSPTKRGSSLEWSQNSEADRKLSILYPWWHDKPYIKCCLSLELYPSLESPGFSSTPFHLQPVRALN